VDLNRPPAPAFQRNTVNGRAQVPHSLPYSCLDWIIDVRKNVIRSIQTTHHPHEGIVTETSNTLSDIYTSTFNSQLTCFTKNREVTLFPASLVDVCLGHCLSVEVVVGFETTRCVAVLGQSPEAADITCLEMPCDLCGTLPHVHTHCTSWSIIAAGCR
jgi:hypothetical protein